MPIAKTDVQNTPHGILLSIANTQYAHFTVYSKYTVPILLPTAKTDVQSTPQGILLSIANTQCAHGFTAHIKYTCTEHAYAAKYLLSIANTPCTQYQFKKNTKKTT